jgi:hypothetical protein
MLGKRTNMETIGILMLSAGGLLLFSGLFFFKDKKKRVNQ